MAKQLITQYQYIPASQQIVFPFPIVQGNILLIVDVTQNVIIYNFASTSTGGTVNGYTLTLTYNTTTYASSDQLLIYYDMPPTPLQVAQAIDAGANADELPLAVTQDANNYFEPDNSNDITVQDLLLQMADKNFNTPLQVSLPTNFKTDPSGALVISDMAGPFTWNSLDASSPYILDCTGYGTVLVAKTTAGVVTPTVSNDKLNFYSTIAVPTSGASAPAITIPTTAGIYLIPVVGRYIKLTGPASAVTCTIYLSAQPYSQLAGTLTQAVTLSGLSAVGTAPSTNPVPIAGQDSVDRAGIGKNTTAYARALVTDVDGRLQVGTKYNFETVQKTADVVRNEGMSMIDILDSILLEMKMMNFYIYHLPEKIVTGQPFTATD